MAEALHNADATVAAVAAKRHSLHRPKPPQPVNAYPLVAIAADLSTEAVNAGCSFARSQPRGHRLMLLNFGPAQVQDGELGAGRRPFYSNADILTALEGAAAAYRLDACHRKSTSATIAYGVGNYRLSSTGYDGSPMPPHLAKEVGAAQLQTAVELRHSLNGRDEAAVAGDLEPGWDPSPLGVRVGKALARGADSGDLVYYDFGTAGHCPPYTGFEPGCGSWTFKDLGDVSQNRMAIALPEIYYDYQAEQWATVRKRWDHRREWAGRCVRDWTSKCYAFAGAISEPTPCGGYLSPLGSWTALWEANPVGSVASELINYNPDRYRCASDRGLATDTQPAAHPRSRSRTATPPRKRHRPDSMRFASTHQDEPRSRHGYSPLPQVEPARVVPRPDPVVPADILQRITNAWRAGDHGSVTVVEAGLAGDDPSGTTGRFVVFREQERPFAQNVDIVDVRGAGALRISQSPTGKRAGHWAQTRAEIGFAGGRGITGTLHLTDDTITLGAG